MILRTDAIVLRAMDYGETSQIVTLFTRELGKVAVLAKGSRMPKSRFGSTLQAGAYTQVVFYYKSGRGLQTLTESVHVVAFHSTPRDLEKIAISLRVVELVHALQEEEQQNTLVFNLLVIVLSRLNEAQARAGNLLPFFEVRLSGLLGFAPAVDRADVQDLPEEGGLLMVATGAVTAHPSAAGTWRRASRAALRAFAICARADIDVVLSMHLKPEVRAELDQLVEAFLKYHVEDQYPFRAAGVISQMTG